MTGVQTCALPICTGAIGTFRHRNHISGVLLRSVRYRGENRDTEQYQDRLTPVNPHLRHKNTIRKAAQPQCLQGIEPLNKERRRPDLNPTIKHIENSVFTESRINTDVANIS